VYHNINDIITDIIREVKVERQMRELLSGALNGLITKCFIKVIFITSKVSLSPRHCNYNSVCLNYAHINRTISKSQSNDAEAVVTLCCHTSQAFR